MKFKTEFKPWHLASIIAVLGALLILPNLIAVLFMPPWFAISSSTKGVEAHVNPIADKTFQVEFHLETATRKIDFTRNFVCRKEIVYGPNFGSTSDKPTGIQFPNQGTIQANLEGKASAYIVVPNPCIIIRTIDYNKAGCSGGRYSPYMGYYTKQPDCSGKYPIIKNHIPMVYWTEDRDNPNTLYANTTMASFSSVDSKIKKVYTNITIMPNLAVDHSGDNSWLNYDFKEKNEQKPSSVYYVVIYQKEKECRNRSIPTWIAQIRSGSDLSLEKDYCTYSLDENLKPINSLEGVLVFKSNVNIKSRNEIEDFIQNLRIKSNQRYNTANVLYIKTLRTDKNRKNQNGNH